MSLALVIGGILLAFAPFRGKLTIDAPVWSPDEKDDRTQELRIRGRCRAPVLSAWRSPGPEDQLALWAVTEGTEMSGYEAPGGLGRRCAPAARRRLSVGGLSVVAGVVAFAVQRRRSPTSRTQNVDKTT